MNRFRPNSAERLVRIIELEAELARERAARSRAEARVAELEDGLRRMSDAAAILLEDDTPASPSTLTSTEDQP